ncbi:MAG TPA: thioredoxin family protein [Candidatus Bathyarchaeia archaeon]|nr:thioredoxin family protein [Candidatus Bathyarchaeia archaeon]
MKKQAILIAICAALLLCVAAAGCTSSTSSSSNVMQTANSSSQTTRASTTAPTPTTTPTGAPTATPTGAPTATPTTTPTTTPLPSGGATSATVLFFYDPSCPHCQAIEPQVQNIPTYGGKVTVQWIDTTQATGLSELHSYGSSTVPTFVLLNSGGSEIWSQVAPTSTDSLNAAINSALGSS